MVFAFSLALTVSTRAQSDPAAASEPAAEQPAPAESAAPAAPEATAPAATAPAAPAEFPTTPEGKKITTIDLKGAIESIDTENHTFTLEGKTFKFVKTGKVFFKRKQKSFGDLKVGDVVAVTYRDRNGENLVSRINK